MALFVGRHLNKIDKKGRTSVPKPFRASFETQSFRGMYAYPSFKFPAIAACDETFMTQLCDSLSAETDFFSDDQDDLATVILENANQLSFDTEGRVIIPQDLLDHAGITDQALFVGRGREIFIWEPTAYETHAKEAFNRAKAAKRTLKLHVKGDGS
ncbi:division/cell wall cluster transcriptional repressor MraZ [Terasakiella sp. SH-1]|uniref:division/cell wall cluster transcriptional repressor MraZ n=1 Tax=Terasakiella sp. SH-1 TaxID=2560057 RepID=UPI001074458A|nr:division/cell wall cluster transcriptional repressor MraZ [Terasakiella sp. SH-1]